MSDQEQIAAKRKGKPGRPATGRGQTVGVRMQPADLAALDAWIERQPDPKPSRPEAIRAAMRAGLLAR